MSFAKIGTRKFVPFITAEVQLHFRVHRERLRHVENEDRLGKVYVLCQRFTPRAILFVMAVFKTFCAVRFGFCVKELHFHSFGLKFNYLFVFGATAPQWARASSFTRFLDQHNDAPQSVGLLWTSDQLVAEASTWQHTTFTRNRHPCPRWDSNPQSQQTSGRRPTP